MELFMEALRRFEVTEKELSNAFWEAYADPYVPSAGIEFRHLYKHIEESRTGGRKLMTYEQMLDEMHRTNLSQDAFEMSIEKDDQGRYKWKYKS